MSPDFTPKFCRRDVVEQRDFRAHTKSHKANGLQCRRLPVSTTSKSCELVFCTREKVEELRFKKTRKSREAEEVSAIYRARRGNQTNWSRLRQYTVGSAIACVYIQDDRFTREIGTARAALTKPLDVIRRPSRRSSGAFGRID